MTFGIIIDNDYLRTLPQYKGKPDSELTAKDRSNVAVQVQNTYQAEATKHLDELKSDFGNGISCMIRVYNASGDRIKVHFTHSWKGGFYKDAPEEFVENRQWAAFMHVKLAAAAKGCTGAVVYRTAADTDVMVSWQCPRAAGSDPTCWAESRAKDHWRNTVTPEFAESVLYGLAKNRNIFTEAGYEVAINIGDNLSPYCEAVIRKA
ncbi:hypothetical protein BD410DRAFT_846202 [Rickenella mellea]|uniref:Uncharacterized protein n=1 Tax=Rickenella mellea TaxID=50990 RepID=A0A4Y7PHG3_9AGAM|nr:hypothetical protein BD410DRAFT_846202 [Rickenella mellea]